MRSAVLILVYKRPDTVKEIFNVLKQVKPPRLYISSNAANPSKNEEALIEETRAIFEEINWPCEVFKKYRSEHIPKAGMSLYYGIDWFFKHEEEGIILQDDVLPHPDFFAYCDELLERYRHDDSIFSISGRNCFYYKQPSSPYSYYFSNYTAIWGWAGWRRSWKLYSFSIDYFKRDLFLKKLNTLNLSKSSKRYYLQRYEDMLNGRIDTEDFQFLLTQWYYNKKSIIPVHNLCKNIGFGRADAVHTKNYDNAIANHDYNCIMPLKHPITTEISSDMDHEYIIQGRVKEKWTTYYKIIFLKTIKKYLKKILF